LNFSIKDNHILLTNPKFYGVYNKFNHSYQIDKLNNKLNINSKVMKITITIIKIK
jgi:hypothetical protein